MVRSNKKKTRQQSEPRGILLNEVKPRTKNQSEYVDSIYDNTITVCAGPSGSGKALPLTNIVYTRNGPIQLKDLTIGDEIASDDGRFYNVSGIFPQGIKQIYRIHFNDGFYVDSCKDHIWQIGTIGNGGQNKEYITEYIYNHHKTSSGKNKFFIHTTQPIKFPKQEQYIHPYVMGLLLAEGCFRSNGLTFTTADTDVVNKVASLLPDGYELSQIQGSDITYGIKRIKFRQSPNDLIVYIKSLGLWGLTSLDKFIPNEYLYSNCEDRIALLQGLMDGDGTVAKESGSPIFNTSSVRLNKDFVELINSLGGIARTTSKIAKYKQLGKIIECNIHYTSYICIENIQCFSLERKQSLVKERSKYFPNRIITNVEILDEKVDMLCIMIDSPNHMFLTNHFTPTHNTMLSVGKACHALANGQIDQILVSRSIIGCGKEIGLLPGDVDQKVHAYFLSVLEYLEYFMDRSVVHNLMKQGIIKLMPVELIRGQTYNNAWMILEEAQNCDLKQLKLFMSRIGHKSKIIISGDEKQSDIRGSCMPFLMNNFNHIDGFKVCKMDYSDILRHPIIPDILEIFDKQGI